MNEIKLKKVWDKVLSGIKPSVSRGTFAALLKPTSLLSINAKTASVAATSPMVINMLKTRFLKEIEESLYLHTGEKVSVIFVPRVGVMLKNKDIDEGPLFAEQTIKNAGNEEKTIGHLPRVRPDFTFNNFAVSGSNQLATVSAQTVAGNIGKSYNPLFIYGPVGVGKTHLMHAIANKVYVDNPSQKIIYITSEEFTNEVVEAIRSNDTGRMKKRFRSANLLIIDDIQFVEGKEKVQEELFHTFNILIDKGSQIALSSDRPPHEIKKLEKRLSSRFAGGLTVDIAKPDFELKTAILLIKAKKFGFDLPIDVAKYLAEQATDTRSLEGLLLRVVTEAKTKNETLTLKVAQQSLGNFVPEKTHHLHADDVIDQVCSFYRIKPTMLTGPKRDAFLVRARHITMFILKEELGLTLTNIGNVMGGRDHTTIMHAVDKVRDLMNNKKEIQEEILGITKTIRG